MSLGSMDEEDFGDEFEDEGGMFMDPGGGDEGRLSQRKRANSSSAKAPLHVFKVVPGLGEDDDDGELT